MLIGICEHIDQAFGNNIDIDSICVLSSLTVIIWITYCTYQIGSYAYRVLLKDVRNCMTIQLIASIILGLIVIIFRNSISHIYSLTETQYTLFNKCLVVHGATLPLLATGEFIHYYMMIKCKNREMLISNIVIYVLMISLDWICLSSGLSLEYMYMGTLISYIVYDILVFKVSGIAQEKDRISIKKIKQGIVYGKDIVIDRLLGKVATVTYAIYASKLGEAHYAIHSVCYMTAVFTEYATNTAYDYNIYVLMHINGAREKFEKVKECMKQTYLILVGVGLLSSFMVLQITHGDVPVLDCLRYWALYNTQCIFIQLYENYRAYITSMQKTHILRWCGMIGILVRIPITLIAYYSGIGLPLLAIASTVDFTMRGIYYYISSKKIIKQESCKV